jgi:hypothetical protein
MVGGFSYLRTGPVHGISFSDVESSNSTTTNVSFG